MSMLFINMGGQNFISKTFINLDIFLERMNYLLSTFMQFIIEQGITLNFCIVNATMYNM